MQAITTKYLGPTNYRGSRIVAQCQAKRIVVPYEYVNDPHKIAAEKLAATLGWDGPWYEGGLPAGNGNCYVRVFLGNGYGSEPAFTIPSQT